ncbi:hypothetical protein P4050_14560 [Pseudomonas aeruginosa]|nr:hypothetical protein [Pseudomonas aeruginosa]
MSTRAPAPAASACENNVVIAARGTAVPAGQMAFISDGMVTGPAPQLPQFDIEV